MRRRVTTFLLLLAAFLAAPLAAATKRPPAEQTKIDRLLAEIERSDAVFIRNGKEYGPSKAASHLKRKLFFAGENRIPTAKDFIRGIATTSAESGEPYKIRLAGGEERKLGDWLTERLAEIEKESAGPS
jgi:Family of unknown function (DUF5329)